MYRSPSGSKAEFCDNFQNVKEICERNNDILIVEDFNTERKNDIYASKLEIVINDNGLKHIMNEHTRITEILIDYITNNRSVAAKSNLSNKISDYEN